MVVAAVLCSRVTAAPPKAQVLVADGSMASRRLVASLPPLSRPGEVPRFQWFSSSSDPKDLAWLIDPEGLLVVRVRHTGESLQALRYWDFAAVAPPEAVEGTSSRSVHPVLYPVGTNRWAMAVLTQHSAMYSGGGAAWSWATFHELLDLDAPAGVSEGGLELLHQDIPFYCDKSIRACFEGNTDCRESWTGVLRLKYGKVDGTGSYPWTAVWEETHQGGEGRSGRREVERASIDLGDPPVTQCTEPMDP